MAEQHDIRDHIRQSIAEELCLSGTDLEYLVEFAESNIVAFSNSLTGLLGSSRWDELEHGAKRLQTLGENVNWEELSNAAFALGEGARQQQRAAVQRAQQDLRKLVRRLTGGGDDPDATSTFKLD